MKVGISMDKVVLEFEGVRYSVFLPWYIRIAKQYRSRHVRYKKLYCWQMHVRLDKGIYLHVFFKNFREVASYEGYTLRIETNPAYYARLQELLAPMWEAAERVYFISSDMAFDVPQALENVFIIANHARRRIRLYKDTRYFGSYDDLERYQQECAAHQRMAESPSAKRVRRCLLGCHSLQSQAGRSHCE